MRDNSPYVEPTSDTYRKPPVVIYMDDRCDCCGTKERLGVVKDWILCEKCERENRD